MLWDAFRVSAVADTQTSRVLLQAVCVGVAGTPDGCVRDGAVLKVAACCLSVFSDSPARPAVSPLRSRLVASREFFTLLSQIASGLGERYPGCQEQM